MGNTNFNNVDKNAVKGKFLSIIGIILAIIAIVASSAAILVNHCVMNTVQVREFRYEITRIDKVSVPEDETMDYALCLNDGSIVHLVYDKDDYGRYHIVYTNNIGTAVITAKASLISSDNDKGAYLTFKSPATKKDEPDFGTAFYDMPEDNVEIHLESDILSELYQSVNANYTNVYDVDNN